MRYITRIDQIPQLSEAEKAALGPVAERYVFRATEYYLNLIDWNDPRDPIRQLIIPRPEELQDWGRLDASNEAANTVAIVRGWRLFREALRQGAGLARRARFVMSHATGKVEILAVDERHIYLRYHRARDAALRGSFLVCRRDDEACWLDDLTILETTPAEPPDSVDAAIPPGLARRHQTHGRPAAAP